MSEELEPDKPKRKISNTELDNVKNYIVVDIAYDLSICLPYKDGIALLASLENAENVSVDRYGNKPITFSMKPITLNSRIVSQKEYRESKMAMLLGVEND
jgi:hypothetical protein